MIWRHFVGPVYQPPDLVISGLTAASGRCRPQARWQGPPTLL